MHTRLARRLILWTLMVYVIGHASGCALLPERIIHDYCKITQKPFQWDSDEEIDATPIRPLRYIETEAEIHKRVCGK